MGTLLPATLWLQLLYSLDVVSLSDDFLVG